MRRDAGVPQLQGKSPASCNDLQVPQQAAAGPHECKCLRQRIIPESEECTACGHGPIINFRGLITAL